MIAKEWNAGEKTMDLWKDFIPTFTGFSTRLKYKPWYYWLLVRIKSWFGVKTELEYEDRNQKGRAEYRIEGKICYVRINYEAVQDGLVVTLPYNALPNTIFEYETADEKQQYIKRQNLLKNIECYTVLGKCGWWCVGSF